MPKRGNYTQKRILRVVHRSLTFCLQRADSRGLDRVEHNPAVDWSNCPVVESVPGKVSGVPLLKGSRMPADAILENYLDGLPADEISDVFELPVEPVRQLLAYACQHVPSVQQ